MALTQALNSKSNIKKSSAADLPTNILQPVQNFYGPVESTAGQTTISLPFSVDQGNLSQFFLTVNGATLSQGASFDYVFINVDQNNQSNTIQLNQPLQAKLNIQAYKTGLKKELEFLTDNRFVQLYEAEGQAFQGFVNSQSFTMTPTTGTPVAGTFYSSIQNRAPITDLSQNLKAQMGIERIMVEGMFQLQTEFGPNGEPVSATPNDPSGQIRFIGGGWVSQLDVVGQQAFTSSPNDYIEITAYCTGLNVLYFNDSNSRDLRASVDGGVETGNILSGTSNVLQNRQYPINVIANAFSGLSLGVHTFKLRNNGASGNNMRIFGFEILNESSSVKVNPGTSYFQGKKYVTAAQQSFNYAASVMGTRGGRVVVYQNADGTISQPFQPVNAALATFSSADHTNEEISRTFFWREFGAGRSDDFSIISGNLPNGAAFTLDDGITTLGISGSCSSSAIVPEGLSTLNVAGTYIILTFVGTGLDIIGQPDSVTRQFDSVQIDGAASIGALSMAANTGRKTYKICSGLPYGTHTVKFSMTSANYSPAIFKFVTYQPKKPAIPSGAIEIADFCVMANYSGTTSSSAGGASSGILRKMSSREMAYVGTWSIASLDTGNFDSGFNLQTQTAGSYVDYTFFGTGVEWNTYFNASVNYSVTVSIDGNANLSAYTTALVTPTTGLTFTASTGTIAGTTGATAGKSRLQISGLPLGTHKIRVYDNAPAASVPVYLDSFDVITPIHSAKSNLYADLQNTLTVGSQGISDNRRLTPIKDILPAQKAWTQAMGVVSGPTTTVNSAIPVPDMAVTIPVSSASGLIEISYSIQINQNSSNGMNVQAYVDGVAVGKLKGSGTTTDNTVSDSLIVPVSKGVHTVVLMWVAGSATTVTAAADRRTLKVREL